MLLLRHATFRDGHPAHFELRLRRHEFLETLAGVKPPSELVPHLTFPGARQLTKFHYSQELKENTSAIGRDVPVLGRATQLLCPKDSTFRMRCLKRNDPLLTEDTPSRMTVKDASELEQQLGGIVEHDVDSEAHRSIVFPLKGPVISSENCPSGRKGRHEELQTVVCSRSLRGDGPCAARRRTSGRRRPGAPRARGWCERRSGCSHSSWRTRAWCRRVVTSGLRRESVRWRLIAVHQPCQHRLVSLMRRAGRRAEVSLGERTT
jgi:hypothetical protein